MYHVLVEANDGRSVERYDWRDEKEILSAVCIPFVRGDRIHVNGRLFEAASVTRLQIMSSMMTPEGLLKRASASQALGAPVPSRRSVIFDVESDQVFERTEQLMQAARLRVLPPLGPVTASPHSEASPPSRPTPSTHVHIQNDFRGSTISGSQFASGLNVSQAVDQRTKVERLVDEAAAIVEGADAPAEDKSDAKEALENIRGATTLERASRWLTLLHGVVSIASKLPPDWWPSIRSALGLP